MKRIIVLFIIAVFATNTIHAQSLGDYKPWITKYGTKNFKDANQKVYISEFNIHYQIFNEVIDFKQGGKMFLTGVKGDATAELAVGLGGVSEEALIATTDKLYQEFTELLQSNGFTILSSADAAKIEAYAGWAKSTGGEVRKSTIPGIVTVSPTGYDYYYKVNNKGEEKKKSKFAASMGNMNDKNVSKELNDAIVANVNLYVIFADYGSGFAPGGAKVKIKPDLRLTDIYTVANKKTEGFRFKGLQTTDNVNSKITFFSGKMGMNAKANFIGALKKPIEIDGVVSEDKLVTSAFGDVDMVGTSNAYYKIYSAESKNVSDLKTLEVDGAKYANGSYMACKKMLLDQTNTFLSSF